MAHIRVQESARKNETAWESAQAEENVSPPESAKGLPGDGDRSTDVRAWGRR